MKRCNVFICCALLGIFLTPIGCGAPEVDPGEAIVLAQGIEGAGVLDQEFTLAQPVAEILGAQTPIAQTLTAGRTGKLVRVALLAAPCYPAWEAQGKSCDFTLRLRTVNDAGEPGVLLAESHLFQISVENPSI